MCLLGFVGCVIATGPSPCQSQLDDWELPSDLCRKQSELRSLYLPPEVDDLRWLEDGLESLTLRDGELDSLSDLPKSLRRLDLAWTELPVDVEWPAGLVALDLSGSRVDDLSKLPQGLLRLRLSVGGDEALRQLDGLPDGLTHLRLEVPDPRTLGLRKIPRSVTHLGLAGAGVTSVTGLPEGLVSLTLERTENLDLRDLSQHPKLSELVVEAAPLPAEAFPRSLDSLQLEAIPASLSLADQVPFLNQLVVTDGVLPPPAELPAYLEVLEGAGGPGYEWPSFLGELPRGLRTLALRDVELTDAAEWEAFPPELTALRLPRCRDEGGFPSLPDGLEKLDLALCRLSTLPDWGGSGLLELNLSLVDLPDLEATSWPSRLERLKWRSYPGSSFPDLPPSLRALDVANSTDLDSLPDLARSSLMCLSIANTGLTDLPPLPPSLLFLDISDTAIESLSGLPDGLVTLVVHRGQLSSLTGMPPKVENLIFTDSVASAEPVIEQLGSSYPCSPGTAPH